LYHGVDVADYNIDCDDKRLMDAFTLVQTNGGGYETIEQDYYDYIILNHVIEHMADPLPTVSRLCSCLRKGGYIYIAFPSTKSLSLPPAKGTLNFCDDPTHVYVPCIREIANILLRSGVSVCYGGRTRDWLRFILGIPLLLIQVINWLVGRKLSARGVWFVLGFESVVIGVKK
jgi:SAM-dependent methyltransferase